MTSRYERAKSEAEQWRLGYDAGWDDCAKVWHDKLALVASIIIVVALVGLALSPFAV